MGDQKEIERFLHKNQESENIQKNCLTKWWNQKFKHQKSICRIIESWPFRTLVILLVIVDTALVISELMLDAFKTRYECQYMENHKKPDERKEEVLDRVEKAMEIAHFASIGILVFFVLELIVRIYANGKEFWNIRRKKMEYFDAFIVITSLAMDLYSLYLEHKILGHQLIIIFSFRLWRFVRIVSSVAEGISDEEKGHKAHLSTQYLIAINRLVEILKHKTSYLETNENNFDLNSIVEQYRLIDNQCQSSLDRLNTNNSLTSSKIVNRFNEEINGIKRRTNRNIIEDYV